MTRSSRCAGGDCVDAFRQGSIVLVRDSKDPGVFQAWTPDEWRGLLGCVKVRWRPEGVSEMVDGCVELGLERHDDKLTFTAAEWDVFTKAVEDGEFEFDKLGEFKSSSFASEGVAEEERAGVFGRGAPARPALSSPAAAIDEPVSAGRTVGVAAEGSDHAATGAGMTGRDTPAPVAAPLNVPAGRFPLTSPEVDAVATTGQPGPDLSGAAEVLVPAVETQETVS